MTFSFTAVIFCRKSFTNEKFRRSEFTAAKIRRRPAKIIHSRKNPSAGRPSQRGGPGNLCAVSIKCNGLHYSALWVINAVSNKKEENSMSLFAIGDLHLHFASELKARNQLYGRVWKDHEKKFRKYCLKMITAEDTLVLVGDHSWGKNLAECGPDLQYICDLPGRKILTRGNHDMFWDAKKTDVLRNLYRDRLFFLQDDYYACKEYALVGTKGFTFEGPFYLDAFGNIAGWDEEQEKRAEKLVQREIARLRASFEAARADGYRKYIMFLHYPPTNILEQESPFTEMAEEYGAEQVIYAHCHGEARFGDSLQGMHHGIQYRLVSGDYLNWKPLKLLD